MEVYKESGEAAPSADAPLALFDTHCHLDMEEFSADRQQVLARARAAGVVGQVIPGIHRAGWDFLLQLSAQEPDLWPALGLHPVYLPQHGADDVEALRRRLQQERAAGRARPVVAIGEIGLDYFVAGLDRDAQQTLFEDQLRVAEEFSLPVLLHVRKAHDQVLSTLRRLKFSQGGIAHAFSGSRQQADQYLALGFRLGFGGTLTYERSRRIRALAAELPLSAIVLETDAPDIVTAAHRGERNSPEYLPEILSALAGLRSESPAELAAATTANAREILRLDRAV